MKNNFVLYKDLLTINGYNKETNKEKFILIPTNGDLVFGKYKKDMSMLEYGEQIAVRKTIYEKLLRVATELKKINKNYKLLVSYGFRDMKKQQEYFNDILEKVKNDFDSEMEMYEYIHEKIAVPTVAGHPTGGAVDAAIYDEEESKILDFGSELLDYSTTKCYYENDDISVKAKKNRKLFRTIMMKEGFAPYDGEWWHFSYGDKEWAFYYKKQEALYDQIEAKKVFTEFIDN